MTAVNIDILIDLKNKNIEEITSIFQQLLNEIEQYLQLKPVKSNIVLIKRDFGKIEVKGKNILGLGAIRTSEGTSLVIEISGQHEKYLPIILLREAYYCFMPDELVENFGVRIYINQIVELNLQHLNVINEWTRLVRTNIIDYEFLFKFYDRLEEFLTLEAYKTHENSIQFFFKYLRENSKLIYDETSDLPDDLTRDYILRYSMSLYDDAMVETIRVIIEIFYLIKHYHALEEYSNYFKEFKDTKKLDTDLSLTKFRESIRWINRSDLSIAPSYYIYWNHVHLIMISFFIKFHPSLSKTQIDTIFKTLDFLYNYNYSESNFAIEVTGRILLPSHYESDLYTFLDKLERDGFIITKRCIPSLFYGNYLNMNYFREFYTKGRIISPFHHLYDKKYNLAFTINHDHQVHFKKRTLLEFFLLHRSMMWSMFGLSFKGSTEIAKRIRFDIFGFLTSQRREIKKLRNYIEQIQADFRIKAGFLDILEANKAYGFFYIKKTLQYMHKCFLLIDNLLSENSTITNERQLQDYIKNHGISQILEENVNFRAKNLQTIIYREIIPLYFKNNAKFQLEREKYRLYKDFLIYCDLLKIYNLKAIQKIIDNKETSRKIYMTKEERLQDLIETYKTEKITGKIVESVLDSFLLEDPVIIKPALINTINSTNFAKYYLEIILKDTENTTQIVKTLRKYFPRIIEVKGKDISSKERLCVLYVFIPNLLLPEKELSVSILYNLFGDDLIKLKSYFSSGFNTATKIRGFYDSESQDFFYTQDFFDQLYLSVKKVFGDPLDPIKEVPIQNRSIFWLSSKNLDKLINHVDRRIFNENNTFELINLTELADFYTNLYDILLNKERVKAAKTKKFFKTYIRSIKFTPSLRSFGLSRYFLYILPTDLNKIDFQLLFSNTFHKVKYQARADNTQGLFIDYYFPYRTPNLAYVNWLSKSKKIISEYCIFSIKKEYHIFQFNSNISSRGWNVDFSTFKTYAQNVLFNAEYRRNLPNLRQYNLDKLNTTEIHGKDSMMYRMLTELQGYHKRDLKSVLGTRNYALIEKISILLRHNLIHPIIKLKNLGFENVIYIILPAVKKDHIEMLVKIFGFFNYGFIYETEGQYYIHGDDEKMFDTGLMIKLYLPEVEFEKFQECFDQIFQYLGIHKYLIMYDMIDGSNLLKTTFGSLDVLTSYNPLKNLKWNKKDKIWMNHKLYGENFEVIYPKLE